MNGSIDEQITVLVAGDFAPVGNVEKLCVTQENNCGKSLFGDAQSVLEDKDFSIVNLECPLTVKTNPISKCGPCIKSDPASINLLKHASFDAVALANNHIFDQGAEGLNDTLELCKINKIKVVGAGKNLLHASEPLTCTIKDKTLSIINIAENEFSIASADSPGANPLDPVKNYTQITKAKAESDYVIVILHGGNEYYPLPSIRMRDTCRFFADIGADAVLVHHSHVPGGYEVYNNTPIFYGLGNFIFPSLKRDGATNDWFNGYFVKLYLTGGEKVDFEIYPYSQCKDELDFKLLEGTRKLDFLSRLNGYKKIVQDDQLLQEEWMRFADENRIDYMSYFMMMNIYKRQLFKRNIFVDKILPKEKLRYVLNVIRCESHRDAVLSAIEETLSE